MKYKFIVYLGHISREWNWHAKALNGKIVADSSEGYVKRSHAVRMAKAIAAGRPVFIKVGAKLIPA